MTSPGRAPPAVLRRAHPPPVAPQGVGANRVKRRQKGKGEGRRASEMRVGCVNMNGLNDECKRMNMINEWMNGRLDVLGVSETHLRGKGAAEGSIREGVWRGVEGMVVWSGLQEEYKGKAKEGVAILLSPRMSDGVIDFECIDSRMVWVRCKVGRLRCVFVCAYAPVSKETCKGKKEMEDFWKKLNECVRKFDERERVIVLGDMNARVGDVGLGEVVGRFGVPGTNGNGEYLVDFCAERRLFLANTFFEHRMIHRYSWKRVDYSGSEQKALIDYVIVDERLRCVQDAKLWCQVLTITL